MESKATTTEGLILFKRTYILLAGIISCLLSGASLASGLSADNKATGLAGEEIVSFTLINADTDQPIQTLTSGATINLAALPTKNLSVRANTSPATIGSVVFVLSGTQSHNQTENILPYALFGDTNGDFKPWTPAVGSYTLKATPYSASRAGGTAGTTLSVSFTVVNQASTQQVVSFTLFDAATKTAIMTLSNGATLNLATLPATYLNIRANTSPSTVGSVVFTLSGAQSKSATENINPYDLMGDNGSWVPTVGSYTLKATPYSASRAGGTAGTALSISFAVVNNSSQSVVTGELKKWHKIAVTFTGPATSETATTNPFLNYRLNVTFSKGSRQLVVPGYFAADGNAKESGATAGNKWQVLFTPDEEGTWSYKASFRTGTNIAVSSSLTAGSPVAFDGATGSFSVGPSDKTGRDFRAKGRLQYVGAHYLRFAQTGEYFLKGGADSPENFLAYQDFDGTYSSGSANYIKTYTPHVGDWKSGDPTWKSGKGKGIIGAVNYLASKGMNAVYFLTMNVNGDGKDVWPWTSHTERYRFDVSKLDQWEVVFTQMDKLGLMLHVVTQEQENDQLLDGGALGVQRKLYYRELIARFGHHLAINWNLGEENTNTDAQRKEFANYIKSLDPYDSFLNVHTYPGQKSTVFTPLLGYATLDGASLQVANVADVHKETLSWVEQSASSGRKWVVNLDEIGPPGDGVLPDAYDYAHNAVRKSALWGNLMAGGGGVEWYFGYNYPNGDRTAQDWRSRDHMWDLTRYALAFFHQYLPFHQMKNNNGLTSSTSDYCFALPGKVYAIYLPAGGTTALTLGTTSSSYQVKWYNPREGGYLQNGSIQQITGAGNQSIGNPPANDGQDWVCLVTNTAGAAELTSSVMQNTRLAGSSSPIVLTFPNPARDHVSVTVHLPAEMPLEIAILDITGRTVHAVTVAPVKVFSDDFDLSAVKPGVYLLKVKYGENQTTRRVVKM
ncbi:DUF5060 domain-containing protein [Pontibacter saemangeumensis]